MAPKVAIIYYSMYGHVAKLAQAEKKGIEAAGGKVDLYQYVSLCGISRIVEGGARTSRWTWAC
jgi:flavorubredoxin